MSMVLRDPQSGQNIEVAEAELFQQCKACGRPVLKGDWIIAWDGHGWVHIAHLPRVLMGMTMSDEYLARAAARAQLGDARPGDKTTVTGELLAALGLETT